MAKYIMTAKEAILTSGSSRGSQIKFFKDDYWYKIDETGPEGKAEELASKILSCSNLKQNEYITYESCTIDYNGKTYDGCRSKNCLSSGEQLLSFERLYNIKTGRSLSEDIIPFTSPKERIEFVIHEISEFCDTDIRDLISKNLTASMILMDTDRHLHNMALIANADLTEFRNAPIFDNGAAFLSNHTIYPPSITVDDIKNGSVTVAGKPFSADLHYQAHVAGFGIKFDFDRIHKMLSNQPDSRIKRIAEYSISKYQNIPDLHIPASHHTLSPDDKITMAIEELPSGNCQSDNENSFNNTLCI